MNQLVAGDWSCVNELHWFEVTRHSLLQQDLKTVAFWVNCDTLKEKGELSCAEGDSARLLFHFLMRPELTN